MGEKKNKKTGIAVFNLTSVWLSQVNAYFVNLHRAFHKTLAYLRSVLHLR